MEEEVVATQEEEAQVAGEGLKVESQETKEGAGEGVKED